MDASYVWFAVLLFVAVVLALEGVHAMWASKHSAEAKRLAARLRTLGEAPVQGALSIERTRPSSRWDWLDDRVLAPLPGGQRLLRYVDSAHTGASAGEVLMLSAGLACAGFMLVLLFGRPLVYAVLGALLPGLLPWWRVARKREQRIRLFEKQIPQALELMGRAMRAGHSFPTAVQMVGEEIADPLGYEFRTLADATNYGVSQQEALMQMADRVPVPDLGYFVVAVVIQRESGGNLAELLDNISTIVRARLKLHGQVRTLSAEGRLSAQILIALPFVTGALINFVTPRFMEVLWTDPAGVRLVGGALVVMAVGVVWMRNIIRIRV